MDLIALIDMDGTLADYDRTLLADLKALASPDEPEPKLSWNDTVPYLEARMRLIKTQPGWWLNLPKLWAGFEILDELRRQGFQVHVLTKGPRHTASAWSEKLLWCQRNLSEGFGMSITSDKGLVYGRVLVDDYPPYMERWLENRPRGLGLMPEAEYNKGFEHPNVLKYSDAKLRSEDWRYALRTKLREAFDRKGGE